MFAACMALMLISCDAAALPQDPDVFLPKIPLRLTSITTIEGKRHPLSAPQKAASLLLFLNVDCPIANRYAPDIARLNRVFESKGVAIFHVYSDPSLSRSAIAKHQSDFSLGGTAVLDKDLKLAKATGVKFTPEAVILDRNRRIRYRGRIDSSFRAHTKDRSARPARKDLEVALKQLLAGSEITVPVTEPVGCRVPGL